MKTFKDFRQLREFEDLGDGKHVFDRDKAQEVAADFAKQSGKAKVERFKSQAGNAYKNIPDKTVEPKDLKKHIVKKLSTDKEHKDYTMHHVGSGNSKAVLLHHKKDGFVGMIGGHSKKEGLHVHESFISENHRGKGLGTAMYEHTAKHYGSIISDTVLSTHSQRIYAHFAKQGKVVVHDKDHGWDKTHHNQPVTATPKAGTTNGKYKFTTPTHKNLAADSAGRISLKILPKKTSKKS